MLARTRQEKILKMLDETGSVTVAELTAQFGASESTIRRDLTEMAAAGLLSKVFGGAVRLGGPVTIREESMAARENLHVEGKRSIGAYAASLIGADDFIYLDAGTTTEAMIPYITETNAVFVTIGVQHALQLSRKGCRVILIGGELKAATEAIIGSEACENLAKYHFAKAFMGTCGVDLNAGFTTQDLNEAVMKQCVIRHARQTYVLAAGDKFGQVCPVTFADYGSAAVITDREPDASYRERGSILVTKS